MRNNSSNFLYMGTIQYEIFGRIDKAEKVFKKGIKLDPKSLGLLVAINRLYAEKDKIAVKRDESLFWKRNSNLKIAEKLFEKPFKYEEDYFQMAELYYTEEMYEESQRCLDDYLDTGIPGPRWHKLQGQIHIAQEDFAEAISAFKKALKQEPHNFGLRVNLGNAYIRKKDYSKAEEVFTKVLQMDPNNVDALIGLGEINLNKSSENGEEGFLDDAEKYFLDAIKLGKSSKGSRRLDRFEPLGKKEDRKYKDLKLSDLYYSLGYIKTKQYEKNRFGLANFLLNDATGYFVKSLYSNPENLKALKAKEKIEKTVKPQRRNTRFEVFGTWFITALALMVFVLCQYFFYFQSAKQEQYALGEKSLAYLGNVLPMDSIAAKNLKSLSGMSFEDKGTLVQAMGQILGQEMINANKAFIDNVDLSVGSSQGDNLLPAGYYVLISFGAILFMIAGLYLPKLLKLKVGVIEIEKNSPSEINEISLLGIQK